MPAAASFTASTASSTSSGVGVWRPTLPDFKPPLVPQWRYMAPFCMTGPGQFAPPAPPAVASPEYAARGGVLAEQVTVLYRVLLGRQPEPGGLAFWVGQLAGGATTAQVSAAIQTSPEFKNRSCR